MTLTLPIAKLWNGVPLPPAARALVTLSLPSEGGVEVNVDAPFFGDPAPPAARGSTDRLWEFEVVELFIAGPGSAYVELEFGPHGHYLALMLADVRAPVCSGMPIDYAAAVTGEGRFRGHAAIPQRYLPPRPWRANAYAVHDGGCISGVARCHHAHAAVPGAAPDFHRPDCFVPVPELD